MDMGAMVFSQRDRLLWKTTPQVLSTGVHISLRIWAFTTTYTQRYHRATPNPAAWVPKPTRRWQSKTSCPHPLRVCWNRGVSYPRHTISPKGRRVAAQPWQPVLRHVCRQAAAGGCAETSWVGGSTAGQPPPPPPQGSPGPLLPPASLFINS